MVGFLVHSISVVFGTIIIKGVRAKFMEIIFYPFFPFLTRCDTTICHIELQIYFIVDRLDCQLISAHYELKLSSLLQFFLWVSISAIGRDDPDSAYIKFYVGSISISLPAGWFATVPSPDK